MIEILLQYFFISFFVLYTYTKLLNIKINRTYYLLHIIFSLVLSFITYLLHSRNLKMIFILLSVAIPIINYFMYHKNLKITVRYSIISLGIICFIHTFSYALISPLLYFGYSFFHNMEILNILEEILCDFTQGIILILVFKTKRLKSGLPDLESKFTGDIGVFIAVIILLASSFFYFKDGSVLYFALLSSLLILFGLAIVFWWRSQIKQSYLTRAHTNEIAELDKVIRSQRDEINNLKVQICELSKIIHKDNKLIPAMELAVRAFISEAGQNENTDGNRYRGESIIKQLNELTDERSGIIKNFELTNKKLPETGVSSVDAIVSYLLCRARKDEIDLSFLPSADVKYLTDKIITENDLNTLLADLGENALISASAKKGGNVLIQIGLAEDTHSQRPCREMFYRIDFFDNGAPFEPDVFAAIGKQRYTTRKDTGGSGIGLMTTCEIARKYSASFEIDENLNHAIYSKRVSVCFNKKGELRVFPKSENQLFSIQKLRIFL